MADRRRAGVWVVGMLGVLGAVSGAAWLARSGRRAEAPGKAPAPSPRAAGALARGDSEALAALARRVTPHPERPDEAFAEAQAAEAVAALGDLRAGFARFAPEDRAKAVGVAGRILARFGIDPAPPCWIEALEPAHAVMVLGLADADAGVRTAALTEVGGLWSWMPGRTPMESEERSIESWKQGMVAPAARRLADREVAPRAAAVACLGKLPINDAAAPAAACVADPDPTVRQQALVGFAARRDLLSEEAVLPLLYDPSPAVALIAERVLKARGLSQDLIGLGRLVAHPRAELRASAIPLLMPRADIDTVVWLLYLSRDPDESVRAKAVEALALRPTPESSRRLREMAGSDASARIRAAAAKVAPAPAPEATVALPPLPGSTGLNPRAN